MGYDAGTIRGRLSRSTGGPRLAPLLRPVVGLAVVLAALRLFLPPFPLDSLDIRWAWFGFGCAAGFTVPRRQALLLIPLPFLARWYTIATGPEYLSRNDSGVELEIYATAMLIAIGLAGIALGIGAGRLLTGFVADRASVPPRDAEHLVLLAVLVLLLVAAVVDVSQGGRFLSLPRPLEPRSYSEEEVRAATAGLAFTVYAAPLSEGAPNGAVRHASAPPGLGPTEVFTLIYCDERCRRSSEVQITSAPPEFCPGGRQTGAAPSRADPVAEQPGEPVAIAGVTWQLRGGGVRAPVRADTILADACVRITAPDRAHFERVAAALRPVNR